MDYLSGSGKKNKRWVNKTSTEVEYTDNNLVESLGSQTVHGWCRGRPFSNKRGITSHMPVRVQVRKDKSNGSSFPDVADMPSPAIHFTCLLFFLLYNKRRIMNKQKAVNELKKLRYEVQSARVKDSVEFEL